MLAGPPNFRPATGEYRRPWKSIPPIAMPFFTVQTAQTEQVAIAFAGRRAVHRRLPKDHFFSHQPNTVEGNASGQ